MNFYGVVIAVITFMIIGVFHPIVIKAEYHLTERCWPLFLAAGIVLIGGSVLASNTMLSCVLGVTGCSCMWSIKELREQKERVRKGWFPANPARNGDAKRQDAGRSGCDGTSSCSEGMAEEYADNAVNCRNDNEKKGNKIMEMRRKEKMISQEEVSLKIYDRMEIAAGQSRYQIVQQPKFPTKSKVLNDRRGDLMLLINGMPVIHIELKRSGVPVSQACTQIEKYAYEGIFAGLFSLLKRKNWSFMLPGLAVR